MKTLKIITLVLVTLLSCSNEKSINDPKQDSIIGKWQLIEIEGGFPTQIEIIENGEIISFNSNLSYSNSTYDCNDGSYSMNNEFINILIPCLTSEELIYRFSFDNNDLLFDSYPSTCIEGCSHKYKKIASE